jgi:hypothetical protein
VLEPSLAHLAKLELPHELTELVSLLALQRQKVNRRNLSRRLHRLYCCIRMFDIA